MLPISFSRSLITVFFGVFSFLFFAHFSPIHAQAWQTVGTYPGGNPGFGTSLTDAVIHVHDGQLYVALDDAGNDVEIYRLESSGSWNQVGTIPDGNIANLGGRGFTTHQGTLYTIARDLTSGGLMAYEFVSVNNWQIIGDDSLACDATGSAYFNCGNNPSAVTGYVGMNGNLYVGTGKVVPSEAWVYEWDGSTWDVIGDVNQLEQPPGGSQATGNVDLIVHNNTLYAGSGHTIGVVRHASLHEYNGTPFSWTQVARDHHTVGNAINSRTLVEYDGDIYIQATTAAFHYIEGNSTLQLVGQAGFGVEQRGLAVCNDFLYSVGQGQVNPPWGDYYNEVWRIDMTSGTPTWVQVGSDFGVGLIWHGAHSIVALDETVYVLGWVEASGDNWAAVSEYTGSEGSCQPAVNGSIEGFVWNDANLDGSVSGGETNQSGVQVTVTGPTNPPSAITDGTAQPGTNYSFTGLPAGTYTVDVTPAFGWATTTTDPVTINIVDSVAYTADFGVVETGGLEGYIWEDNDPFCTKNAGEVNYTDTSVLLDLTHNTYPAYSYTFSTTGSSSGNNFSWSQIVPGEYTLSIDTSPWPPEPAQGPGYVATTQTSTTVTINPGVTVTSPEASCVF